MRLTPKPLVFFQREVGRQTGVELGVGAPDSVPGDEVMLPEPSRQEAEVSVHIAFRLLIKIKGRRTKNHFVKPGTFRWSSVTRLPGLRLCGSSQ